MKQIKSLWARLWKTPEYKWLIGIPAGAFLMLAIGVVAFPAFQFTMHATSTNEFCSTCHLQMDTVVQEYQESIHFNNRLGIQAECQDCHIPKEFIPTLITKTKALKDTALFLIKDFPKEEFEARREHLAEATQSTIRAQNSSTCQSCHNIENMDRSQQKRQAARKHTAKYLDKKTCIDCHTGVAHNLPELNLDDLL